MNLSIFAVFLAGVVSFLSPCVLPLVPGYVSMLSGIGVEQLKEGEGSTGHLFSSALAFVMGFSIVFITFGASASAVGSFLVRNRTLLAPIAGSLIILFGLHLMGWLVKISVRVGLIIAGVLIAIGVVLNLKGISAGSVVTPVMFYAISLIFLIGPTLTRWLNRDVHLNNVGGSRPGNRKRIPDGFCVRVRLDAVHRTDPRRRAGCCRDARHNRPGNHVAGVLFGWSGDSVFADGAIHRAIPQVLQKLPQIHAHGGSVQRSFTAPDRRTRFRQPAHGNFQPPGIFPAGELDSRSE